jgi:hypothetical protein
MKHFIFLLPTAEVAAHAPHNKQLQRTVIPRRWRAASAPLHYALAARSTAQRAAAQLRRYAPALAHRTN